MDWKSIAIEKLKDHEARRQALESIPLEIAQVESTMTSIRSASADGVAIRGSRGNGREEMLLNCIVQKDELQRALERTRLAVEVVDRILEKMGGEDGLILERLFLHPERGAIDRLAGDLALDVKTVYKRRDAVRVHVIAVIGSKDKTGMLPPVAIGNLQAELLPLVLPQEIHCFPGEIEKTDVAGFGVAQVGAFALGGYKGFVDLHPVIIEIYLFPL